MKVSEIVDEGKRGYECRDYIVKVENGKSICCNCGKEKLSENRGFNSALSLEVSVEKLRKLGYVKMPGEEEIIKMLDGYKSHCEIMSGKLGLFACLEKHYCVLRQGDSRCNFLKVIDDNAALRQRISELEAGKVGDKGVITCYAEEIRNRVDKILALVNGEGK